MCLGSVRLWLWLALAGALPVPIWLLGPGSVPALHLFELGAVAIAFGLAESLHGVVGLTALVFLSQAVVYVALLYAVAAVITRLLRGFPGLLLVLAALLVTTACFVPVYHSPYHAQSAQVTLLAVYR